MPHATEVEQLLQFEFDGLAPGGEIRKRMRINTAGLLEHLESTGNRSKIDEAWLIPDTLQNPAGIWRGLNRDGQDGVYCYSSVPLGAFAAEHNKEFEIFTNNKVFLVFLNGQLEAIKWRYCQADPHQPGFPIGHETRFGERLWPTD